MTNGPLRTFAGFGLEEFRASVERADVSAPAVSEWSVGMHTHHCCLSMTGICGFLLRSDSPAPRPRPTTMGSLLLLVGRIPRGRAEAPDVARPDPGMDSAELRTLLDRSEEMLTEARKAPREAWFEHFSMGVFRRDQALRFLRIHNEHHLRIIRDILAAG